MSRTYRRQKGDRRFTDINEKNRQNGWYFRSYYCPVRKYYDVCITDLNGTKHYVRESKVVVECTDPWDYEDESAYIRKMQRDGMSDSSKYKYYKEKSNEQERMYAKVQFARMNKISKFEDMHFIPRGCRFLDNWYY